MVNWSGIGTTQGLTVQDDMFAKRRNNGPDPTAKAFFMSSNIGFWDYLWKLSDVTCNSHAYP